MLTEQSGINKSFLTKGVDVCFLVFTKLILPSVRCWAKAQKPFPCKCDPTVAILYFSQMTFT